jgi:PP-loop superfamily ATP-utilizing enzyme
MMAQEIDSIVNIYGNMQMLRKNNTLTTFLKKIGFEFITVYLLGYRLGSFNEQISSALRSKF